MKPKIQQQAGGGEVRGKMKADLSKATGAFPDNLGAIIRNARNQLGWSRENLCGESKISDGTIKNLEKGIPCRAKTIWMVVDALNVALRKRGLPTILESGPGEDDETECHGKCRTEITAF